jgi:hypothetical protein
MLLLAASACGTAPGLDSIHAATTITAITTNTTTTESTPGPTDGVVSRVLVGDDLLACMIGAWALDVDSYEAELKARLDPSGLFKQFNVVSGGGSLIIRADRTFTLSYDDLDIRIGELQWEGSLPDEMVLVSGEVAGGFELEENVFLAGEVDDPVLVISTGRVGDELHEVPPAQGARALRMGTRANHPYYLEKITINCDAEHLVVNDEVRIDPHTGDGPSTIWVRVEEAEG